MNERIEEMKNKKRWTSFIKLDMRIYSEIMEVCLDETFEIRRNAGNLLVFRLEGQKERYKR